MATASTAFSADVLKLDLDQATARVTTAIQKQVGDLKRRGAVLGISGGIDSSVTAALCARALGGDRVLGIYMPEADSDPESLRLGQALAESQGIKSVLEDIRPALEGMGCYRRRDEFVRMVVPEYGPGWKFKIVLPKATEGASYNVFSIVVESPDGKQDRHRLPPTAFLGIVACTNMKQRTRKQTEYYHADRLHYAVAGTPNRLEYDQGFFVKGGDGLADFKPIAHLYKTQTYALARHLGVPADICNRQPTTDTYSLAQSQEEFYFSLPYDKMDLCLYAKNHDVSAEAVAPVVGLTVPQVEHVFRDIDQKRRTTRYLHATPLLVEAVAELGLEK